ncbi:MAG: VanZ family protein [Clostridia bacterium]|nr:VanZ family protein [Clostridia bacterium]
MKIWTYRIILITFILLTVGFIVFNSTRTGEQSAKISQNVSEKVAEIVIPNFSEMKDPTRAETVSKVHFTVRNVAHALEFAALGFFVALLFATFKFNYGRHLIPVALSLLVCFTATVCDEFLQGIIDGRASDINDVLMDNLGALFGVLSAIVVDFIGCAVLRKIKKKSRAE